MTDGIPVTRRTVMQGVGVGVSFLCVGSACGADKMLAYASDAGGEPQPIASESVSADVQYGFLMNVSRCVDCGKCVEACRLWSRTPEGVPSRRKITEYHDKQGRVIRISSSCMHCADPSCVKVCPAGAIAKGDGGIVSVDKDLCIGCKYCYQACPFEVPHYDSHSMDKCDLCLEAGVPVGEAPHCVQACKVQALRFGAMPDLLALSTRARKVGGSTDPSFVLI